MSSTNTTHHLEAPRASDNGNVHSSEIDQLHVNDNGSSSKDCFHGHNVISHTRNFPVFNFLSRFF